MKWVGFKLVCCVVAAGLMWGASQQSESFLDYVRDPDLMAEHAEQSRQHEAEVNALVQTPEGVVQFVDTAVFSPTSNYDVWMYQRVSRNLGEKIYPRVIEILKDPELRERLHSVRESPDDLDDGPMVRLCDLLDNDRALPAEIVLLLEPFMTAESDEIRKNLAMVVAQSGRPESLATITLGLGDEDDYVRSYVLMGLRRALDAERLYTALRDPVFKLVAEMWPKDRAFSVCNDIPRVLLSLDRERGVARLTESDVFTAKFEPVWRILGAFEDHDVSVERETLFALKEGFEVGKLDFPADAGLAAVLALLGEHRHADDLALLEGYLDHEEARVVDGAISGLYRYHRFDERVRDVWDARDELGWDKLTDAERHILAVWILDGQVNNGGFDLFFFNSAGDYYEDALAGLAAIKATKHHAILKSASDRFGNAGPSKDPDVRIDQLSVIARKSEDPFEAEDSAWYEDKDENLSLLLFRYDIANTAGRER